MIHPRIMKCRIIPAWEWNVSLSDLSHSDKSSALSDSVQHCAPKWSHSTTARNHQVFPRWINSLHNQNFVCYLHVAVAGFVEHVSAEL